MKLIAGTLLTFTTFALVGSVREVPIAVDHDPPARSTVSPAVSNEPVRRTCAPGPRRASDMVVDRGGFLKVHSRGNPDYREFHFTRAMFSEDGRRGGFFSRGGDYLGDSGPVWSIDYPNADRTMMSIATRLSNLDACEYENPVSLADPDLRHFPFLYTLEWGYASLTEAEVQGLRDYLTAGGVMMVDDFWGSREWFNFERQMQRVLPDYSIVDIPRDHVFFRAYYDVEGEILQVPNVGNGRAVGAGIPGAMTSEQDGFEPRVRGIFDDHGRLMVIIFWNTDLGDALEWAEDPYYPLHYSTFATEMFLNTIIYAMTY